MCGRNLTGIILQEVAERAVQDTRAPCGEGGGMTVGVETVASGFYTDQLDVRIRHELMEDAHCVGTAAHTGNNSGRGRLRQGMQLLPRLATDNCLKVPHQTRIGIGAYHRADDVVAVLNGRHPIAHGFVGRIFQCLCARCHGAHIGAQQFHAIHIERLTLYILGTHVNHTFESEERTHGGGRHTVLTGAGLGYDASLVHAAREQDLTERVVDLVRARVIQVLALQVHFHATNALTQALRAIQRRGPPNVIAPELLELAPECPINTRGGVGRTQFVERGYECFGDVATTKRSKTFGYSAHHFTTADASVRAAVTKASIRSNDFSPTDCSTPELVSTTLGASKRMACATFSAVSPPARTTRRSADKRLRCARNASHEKRVPVPPAIPAWNASSSSVVGSA